MATSDPLFPGTSAVPPRAVCRVGIRPERASPGGPL
jgi:hypothetical protein